MKKVLISGACGFVGKHLIDELVSNGYEVIACGSKPYADVPNGVKYEQMNILDIEQVKRVIDSYNPEYFVNLAAVSSVGKSWEIPQQTVEVNVVGTINILEVLKSKNCKVLLIGSSEEYSSSNMPLNENSLLDANNPYGISKIAQESFARLYANKYGMNIVCTRSFNHIGVGQGDSFAIPSFCKQVAEIEKSGKPGTIYVGNLGSYRDMSDVKDVVHVYRMLLENDTKEFVYNVGSGNVYKMEEILNYIISLSNQDISIEIDPNKYRPIDTPYVCCDNSRISEYFNGTSIEETINRIYNDYLDDYERKRKL